jgi:hypothetical protein
MDRDEHSALCVVAPIEERRINHRRFFKCTGRYHCRFLALSGTLAIAMRYKCLCRNCRKSIWSAWSISMCTSSNTQEQASREQFYRCENLHVGSNT